MVRPFARAHLPRSQPLTHLLPLLFFLGHVRDTYGEYIEFLAGLIVVLCVLYLVLGGFDWFIDTLGFICASSAGATFPTSSS